MRGIWAVLVGFLLVPISFASILDDISFDKTGLPLESCSIDILQDTSFSNGFEQTWVNNLHNPNRVDNKDSCALPALGKNPFWRLSEISTYLHFCENPDNLVESNTVGNYKLEANNPAGKFLEKLGDGHIRMFIDTSQDENNGCRINARGEGIESNDDKFWWPHFGITQDGFEIDLDRPDPLVLSGSIKLNEFRQNYFCTKDEAWAIDLTDPQIANEQVSNNQGSFNAYFVLRPKDSNSDLPEYFLWTPIKYTGNNDGISLDGYDRPGFDTVGTIGYILPNDDGVTQKLLSSQWVNFNIDVLKLAQESFVRFNADRGTSHDFKDYEIYQFEILIETYNGGFITDLEFKDVALESYTTSCNVLETEPIYFYSPRFSDFIQPGETKDVNGEQWEGWSGAQDWVLRPSYTNVACVNSDFQFFGGACVENQIQTNTVEVQPQTNTIETQLQTEIIYADYVFHPASSIFITTVSGLTALDTYLDEYSADFKASLKAINTDPIWVDVVQPTLVPKTDIVHLRSSGVDIKTGEYQGVGTADPYISKTIPIPSDCRDATKFEFTIDAKNHDVTLSGPFSQFQRSGTFTETIEKSRTNADLQQIEVYAIFKLRDAGFVEVKLNRCLV